MARQMSAIHGARCTKCHKLGLPFAGPQSLQHNEGSGLARLDHHAHQMGMHAFQAFMIARQQTVHAHAPAAGTRLSQTRTVPSAASAA
jgi:hypothetical protein